MTEEASPVRTTIETAQSSYARGTTVTVVVKDSTWETPTRAEVTILRVDPLEDAFCLASGGPLNRVGPDVRIPVHGTENLRAGLYRIHGLVIVTDSTEQAMNARASLDPGLCLFELTEHRADRTAPELVQMYRAILAERDADLLRGFGGDSRSAGMEEYRVIVAVTDCYLTYPMRVGQYEIGPAGSLSLRSEADLINGILSHAGLPHAVSLNDSGPDSHGRPAIVANFPRVFARSVAEAVNDVVEPEMRLLCSVLALGRNSSPRVIGGVVIENHKNPRRMFHWMHAPQYRGNLLGGVLSGEDPRLIRAQLETARRSDRLKLYLSLYHEAEGEQRPEIAYFRYWLVLETIARAKGYAHRPLRMWDGTVRLNNQGDEYHIEDRNAAQLVFELIRETLASRYSERALGDRLQQGSFVEMVSIWHSHRNHLVHHGGCFPDDATICKRHRDKDRKCHQARQELPETDDDLYLDALRATAQLIIEHQFLA